MPSAMLRRDADGRLIFYVARKDLEETVVSVERDDDQVWGGEIALGDGSRVYVDLLSPPPAMPVTVKFRKV